MKATLEFNLPDDQAEHYCAIKGAEKLIAAHSFYKEVLTQLKNK
jgi:hypothetical protein